VQGRCSLVVVAGKTFLCAKQPSPTGSGAMASAPHVKRVPEPRQRALWPRVGALSSWAASVRWSASAVWATPAIPVRRCGRARAGRTRGVRAGRARFRLSSRLKYKKIFFYFSFGFKLNLNFKNLYQNI
jgi:hypothetical protein